MGPDASSGLSNPRPNFEDPATQSFDFEFLPGGSIQIIAESDGTSGKPVHAGEVETGWPGIDDSSADPYSDGS